MKSYTKKGFTLLEILLVMALLAILFIIVLYALNPNRIIKGVNDNKRQADALSLYQALEQYALKTGSYPPDIQSIPPGESRVICKTGAPACADKVNLSAILIPNYIASIPSYFSNSTNSGYFIVKDANRKIGIGGFKELDNSQFVQGLSTQTFAPTQKKVEYLIIGGGGGGGLLGGSRGGGGGAGGYRSSVPYENSGGNTTAEPKVTVTETSYPVVVGGGGAGGTAACAGGSNGPGSDGGASSALGITAAGGGGGGGNSAGRAGGSSGGSGNTATSPNPIIPAAPPVATAQGYKGGINQGGGGGAGSPGGDGLSGSGGSGLASSITGAWITRGVGGTNSAGIVNSGGGGGRGNYCAGGSAGGSGIVIIRYQTDGSDGISPSSTGGTKTTSGAYTIHTFTSNGTFTVVASNPYF